KSLQRSAPPHARQDAKPNRPSGTVIATTLATWSSRACRPPDRDGSAAWTGGGLGIVELVATDRSAERRSPRLFRPRAESTAPSRRERRRAVAHRGGVIARSGEQPAVDPRAQTVDLLARPRPVAGHVPFVELVVDRLGVRAHVVVGKQVEVGHHRRAVALAKQRSD